MSENNEKKSLNYRDPMDAVINHIHRAQLILIKELRGEDLNAIIGGFNKLVNHIKEKKVSL